MNNFGLMERRDFYMIFLIKQEFRLQVGPGQSEKVILSDILLNLPNFELGNQINIVEKQECDFKRTWN